MAPALSNSMLHHCLLLEHVYALVRSIEVAAPPAPPSGCIPARHNNPECMWPTHCCGYAHQQQTMHSHTSSQYSYALRVRTWCYDIWCNMQLAYWQVVCQATENTDNSVQQHEHLYREFHLGASLVYEYIEFTHITDKAIRQINSVRRKVRYICQRLVNSCTMGRPSNHGSVHELDMHTHQADRKEGWVHKKYLPAYR